MKRLELNHWFSKDNNLNISLMRFYVEINIEDNLFKMKIYDSNQDKVLLNFNTLEESISFTEDIINKCHTTQEIIDKYNELYKEKDDIDDNIKQLVNLLMDSYNEAYNYYEPIVKMIIKTKCKDINYIDHTLDNVMDIYTDKGFDLFIELLNYYKTINKENADEYLEILKDFREDEYNEYVKKLVKKND